MAKNTYTLNGHTVTDDFVLTDNPNYPFAYQFMRPEIATDAVIFGFDGSQLQILLIKRKDEPFKDKWALPGGFLQPYETVDECVGKVVDAVKEVDGQMFICADHGNAEEILDDEDKPMTAHTTNLVPFCINRTDIKLKQSEGKLADIAPTLLDLLGVEKPAEMTGESLIVR